MLPKTSAFVKPYDRETKWGHLFIEDDKFLEKYNGICNKVSNSIKKELDCETIYHKTFLKTKVSSYGQEAIGFHDNEVPKVESAYTCLLVILIDFILEKDENYYLRLF